MNTGFSESNWPEPSTFKSTAETPTTEPSDEVAANEAGVLYEATDSEVETVLSAGAETVKAIALAGVVAALTDATDEKTGAAIGATVNNAAAAAPKYLTFLFIMWISSLDFCCNRKFRS